MKRSNKLYEYLEVSGVLDSGTAPDIAEARRQYVRQYKAAWRRKKRAETKSITVSFTQREFNTISNAANAHVMNPTQFVQSAALFFGEQQTMPMDIVVINEIRALLLQNYHAIKDLADEGKLKPQTERQLLTGLYEIGNAIVNKLGNPQLLDGEISTVIKQNPEYKTVVGHILKTA